MRDLEIRGAGNLLGDEQSGHVAALGFELYMQMLDEAVRGMDGEGGRRRAPSRCASTSTSTPTCPPTTSPTSRRRSTCTGASPARARSPSSACCATSSRTASARCPQPLENLIALQQARIKLGEAGARAVSFRGGRLAVDADRSRRRARRGGCSERCPEALYEPGKSQLSAARPRRSRAALSRSRPCGRCPSCGHARRRHDRATLARSSDRGSHVMPSKYRSLALCAFFVLPASR